MSIDDTARTMERTNEHFGQHLDDLARTGALVQVVPAHRPGVEQVDPLAQVLDPWNHPWEAARQAAAVDWDRYWAWLASGQQGLGPDFFDTDPRTPAQRLQQYALEVRP